MIRRPCFRLENQRLSIAILHALSHRMGLPRSFDQGSGATAVVCLAGDINGGPSPSFDIHATAGPGTGISHAITPLFQIVPVAGTNGLSPEFHLLAYKKFRASSSFGMSFLRTTRHQKKHPFFFLSFSVSTFIAEPTPRPPFRSPWQTSELSPYIATLPFRDSADNLCNRHLLLFLTVTIWSASQPDRSRPMRERKSAR